MRQSKARIRSVTNKKTGKRIDLLNTPTLTRQQQYLMNSARNTCDAWGDELHGHVLITWDGDGRRMGAYGWSDRSPIAPSMLPAYTSHGIYTLLRNDGYFGSTGD